MNLDIFKMEKIKNYAVWQIHLIDGGYEAFSATQCNSNEDSWFDQPIIWLQFSIFSSERCKEI